VKARKFLARYQFFDVICLAGLFFKLRRHKKAFSLIKFQIRYLLSKNFLDKEQAIVNFMKFDG